MLPLCGVVVIAITGADTPISQSVSFLFPPLLPLLPLPPLLPKHPIQY